MNDSYKHPNWQRKRLEILSRDDFTCVACGDKESTLHVHHIAYDSGEVWDVPNEYLQTLCEKCHADLGAHPKGGVAWTRTSGRQPCVMLFWCPACSGRRFRKRGSEYTCDGCGWRTEELNTVPEMGTTIVFVEDKPNEPQTYSVKWIKGIGTKARKGGATEKQLFEAMFPESSLGTLFEELQSLTKVLRDSLAAGGMSDEDEAAAVLAVVRARRILADSMACKDAAT